jgi:hypothetical protein
MRTYYEGDERFDWCISAGGSIYQMRNVYNGGVTDLLCPQNANAYTDGVIQWVTWDTSEIQTGCEQSGDPSAGYYNLNQAGTSGEENTPPDANCYAPIITVYVTNSPTPQVDVYSLAQDQWEDCMQSIYKATNSVLTRYRLMQWGAIMVRRIVMFGQVYKDSSPYSLGKFQVQGWTPFGSAIYDAMAFA